jgi:NAD(P)-dependent dehydrogenase (short-subunit alcohol dehydrogenase family)
MRAAGVGRIVAIGSRAGLGKLNRVAYSGSKAALSGMVRTMALELGGDGITVNIVAPGPINTSLFRAATKPGSADWFNLNYGVPVGFVGEGEDVAHCVSYFTSDQARFVTGQLLYVCGGTSVAFLSPEGRNIDHKFAKAYPETQTNR